MAEHRVFSMGFATIYAAWLAKAERKGRSKDELDAVLVWQTGHDAAGLAALRATGADLRGFYQTAPAPNPKRMEVSGLICGIRVEELEDPLMREMRITDKLVDELAKGRPMAKVLRQ